MKKKRILALLTLVIVGLVGGYHTIFSFSDTPQLSTITHQGTRLSKQCYYHRDPIAIDEQGTLNLLVWNLYKQNREQWRSALDTFTHDTQLVLLQEASMNDELKQWINQGRWNGQQVDAFQAFDATAGVLNLAVELPEKACAYTELEPWLQLPKSGLYATYALSNGEVLAVVNVHAVNFTLGTEEYHHQLSELSQALQHHHGPIIIAGDFNSWSEARLQEIHQVIHSLGMQEAQFTPDHRRRFINDLPLDHLFYRGLQLFSAQSPATDASDHTPLLAQFRLNKAQE